MVDNTISQRLLKEQNFKDHWKVMPFSTLYHTEVVSTGFFTASILWPSNDKNKLRILFIYTILFVFTIYGLHAKIELLVLPNIAVHDHVSHISAST